MYRSLITDRYLDKIDIYGATMPLATLHSLLDFIVQKIADDGLSDISLMGCFPPADQDLDSTVMWSLMQKVAKPKLLNLSFGDFKGASH